MARYLELAFFFPYPGLPRQTESDCVYEMRYFGSAWDSVSDLSGVDACSSRHPCSPVVHVFVGYVHCGESPCLCLVPATASACGCSCVCDLVHVHPNANATASVCSVCVPSPAHTRPRSSPSSNRHPRLSNVAVAVPYALRPIRLSRGHPAASAAWTVLQRQPLLHVPSSLSAPAHLAPSLFPGPRVPVHAI